MWHSPDSGQYLPVCGNGNQLQASGQGEEGGGEKSQARRTRWRDKCRQCPEREGEGGWRRHVGGVSLHFQKGYRHYIMCTHQQSTSSSSSCPKQHKHEFTFIEPLNSTKDIRVQNIFSLYCFHGHTNSCHHKHTLFYFILWRLEPRLYESFCTHLCLVS